MLRARRKRHEHDLRLADQVSEAARALGRCVRACFRRLLRRVGDGIQPEEAGRLGLLRLPGNMRSLPWIAANAAPVAGAGAAGPAEARASAAAEPAEPTQGAPRVQS